MMTPADEGRSDGPATMPSAESGWWERERARFIRQRVLTQSSDGDLVADIGCGRGTMFDGRVGLERTAICVDSHIWPEWSQREGIFVCAAADRLPFRDGVFSVVGSFDVIEHIDDDVAALREQARVVRSDGVVACAVPSDERLWSHHDDAVGHKRRYSRSSLIEAARAAGLTATRVTHFYSFLWLPAWLTRRSSLRTSEPGSGSSVVARAMQCVVTAVCRLEHQIVQRASLPFGTSLWMETRPDERATRRHGT